MMSARAPMVLRGAALAALLVSGALALPYRGGRGHSTPHHNASATLANTRAAIARAREDEKVRMLHGSGFIPAVTMEYWKYIQTRGPILIIAAAAGEDGLASATSYINNFMSMGEMCMARAPFLCTTLSPTPHMLLCLSFTKRSRSTRDRDELLANLRRALPGAGRRQQHPGRRPRGALGLGRIVALYYNGSSTLYLRSCVIQ
jgi:hypothetical protein